MSVRHSVLIAESESLFRVGLRALLSSEADIEVIAEAENGTEAVRQACVFNPSLVLMGLSMPDCGGLEAISEIKKCLPIIKILVVTMHKTDDVIKAAFRNGASGYILKESSPDELRVAIRTVLRGKIYVSPDVAERLVYSFLIRAGVESAEQMLASDGLSVREKQVLKLVAEGFANKRIADQLTISIKTVEKHRSSLMSKLNLRNTAAITAYAINRGIAQFDIKRHEPVRLAAR